MSTAAHLSPTTPDYCNSSKADARDTFISVYREVTGRTAQLLPDGPQYVTLCAEQNPAKPDCELEQMQRLGLRLSQYVGIDHSASVIMLNQSRYPTATFIHKSWVDAVMSTSPWNPAFIHYDTVANADSEPAISALATTMELCPTGCFIAANFITRNPYSGEVIDIDTVAERLGELTDLSGWKHCGTFSYVGDGCAAEMSYLLLYKGEA